MNLNGTINDENTVHIDEISKIFLKIFYNYRMIFCLFFSFILSKYIIKCHVTFET